MAERKKTKVVALSLKIEVVEQAKKNAKSENRTLSNYIETLLIQENKRSKN